MPPVGGTEKNRDKISKEVWDSVAESVKRVDDIFFGTSGGTSAVKTIIPEAMRDRTFAACRIATGTLFLNTKYYGDPKYTAEEYERCVKTGFHPQGTTWEHIVDHEAGHAYEKIVNEAYMRKSNITTSSPQYYDYLFKFNGIKEIIKKAVGNVGREMRKETGSAPTVRELKGSISQYALKDHHETFAEAVADYSANGKKANKLSIEIVRLAKETLK